MIDGHRDFLRIAKYANSNAAAKCSKNSVRDWFPPWAAANNKACSNTAVVRFRVKTRNWLIRSPRQTTSSVYPAERAPRSVKKNWKAVIGGEV
jgi:hypothetical protein